MAKRIDQVTIDFSQMRLIGVYALQKSAVAEIKVRETALGKQTKKSEKLINKIEAKMHKIKRKTKVREESNLRLENVINLACTNLNDE